MTAPIHPAGAPPRIHVLPAILADQIAAGEVVERPASVVKELVENALDAGATRVEIDVVGGGRELIRIVDDGSGMTAEEAHLALQRHATSKLTAFDQLLDLPTMGFRGEALPSIAAVSRLGLSTRVEGSIEGYRLVVEAGIEATAQGMPAGLARGTRVEVRDLFFNVPARLKFLKADVTETAHVVDTVVRLGLSRPEVHFRLRGGDGRVLVDLPPHASLLERARAALSRRGAVHLHVAEGTEHGVHVLACLGAPTEAASSSRNSYLFVNRRTVRDRGLLQALALGYGELVERGRYPTAVVHVEVAGGGVDINVHPQKTEVRFARPQEVYAAVRHVVRAACAKAPWLAAPEASAVRVSRLPPEPAPPPKKGQYQTTWDAKRIDEALRLFAPRERPSDPPPAAADDDADAAASSVDAPASSVDATAPYASSSLSSPAAPAPVPAPHLEGFFSSLRYLGQIHLTYLVCESGGGGGELVLIDQHAAHERVEFERLKTAHAQHRVRTQRLLFPHTLDLDDAQAAATREHAAVLADLGFDIEPFGGRSYAVKAVPEPLREAPLTEVLIDILDELAARGESEVLADRLDHLFATMACHSVVRAGDLLDDRRVRALLDSMDGIDFRAHCPHGRPVLLRMSIGEIERRFGRT